MPDPEIKSDHPSGARRRRGVLFATIALVALFGASFAANIDINSGTEVEFGQGIEQIVACDAEGVALDTPGVVVTLTSSDPTLVYPSSSSTASPSPSSTASPSPSASPVLQFSVSGLVVSDIDEQCLGKTLSVGLYDEAGAILDEVVFDLDAQVLTAAPYRAGASADDTTLGCEPDDPPAFPDNSSFLSGRDCFPSSDGLASGISAQEVAYVALETSDPAA